MSNTSMYSPKQELKRLMWFAHEVGKLDNRKIDSSVKMVLLGISNEFARMNVPHAEMTKIWYEGVANQCGLSVDAVQKGVIKLVKIGFLKKEVKWEEDKITHEKKKRVWLAFSSEVLANPEPMIMEVEKSNRGGKRSSVQCPHCGEYHALAKRTTFSCEGCGGVIEAMTVIERVRNVPPDESTLDEENVAHQALLARLDSLIEGSEAFYDAADIPDDVVDELGGPEAALTAQPIEIAKLMAVPMHIRQGLSDEDMELVDEVVVGMRSDNGLGDKKGRRASDTREKAV